MLLIGVVGFGGGFTAPDSRRARAASTTRRRADSTPGGGIVARFSSSRPTSGREDAAPGCFETETRRSGFVGSNATVLNTSVSVASRASTSSSSSEDTASPRALRPARSASLRARASRDSCRRTYVRRGVVGGNRGSLVSSSRTYASAARARLGGGTGSTYVRRSWRSRALRARRTASSSETAISASMRTRASEGSSSSGNSREDVSRVTTASVWRSDRNASSSEETDALLAPFGLSTPLPSFCLFIAEYRAAYARSTRESTRRVSAVSEIRFRARVRS